MAPDLWQLGPMVALEHTYYHKYNVVEHGSAKQDIGALQSATRNRTTYRKDTTHQDPIVVACAQNPMEGRISRSVNSLRIYNPPKTEVKTKRTSGRNGKPAASACWQCRKRKTKCSAQRPVCSFCNARGLECSWDVLDGLTSYQDLQRKVREAETSLDNLCAFVEALKTADNQTSTMLLAKLRLGDSVEELVQSLPSSFCRFHSP